MSAAQPEVSFGPCCFCGNSIAKVGADPCRLTVETAQNKWQVWFCHAACLRAQLVADSSLEPSAL
jgi:hypothetical protein